MNLPWRRRNADNDDQPVSSNRRQRSTRTNSTNNPDQPSPVIQEKRRQRIAIFVGASLILVILVIVGLGFYKEFVEPPRVMAGSIRGETFTMGDLVQRLRVRQGINRYEGGFVDLSVDPFQFLQDLLFVEIVRQAAPTLGLNADDELTDQAIRRQFYPQVPEGQQSDEAQLEKEFKNTYQGFLTQVRLSDEEYREMVQDQMLLFQLSGLLSSSIPDKPDQVEVEWIRIDFEVNVIPEEVKNRLEEEDFSNVAVEFFNPMEYGDETGYVGWVPRGAFPDLDPYLFGDGESEPLQVGQISEPLYGGDATYILRVISPSEPHELTARMRVKLTNQLVHTWRSDQMERGSKEKWLKVNFDSDRYAWVAEQIRVTAPRVDNNEEGEGQGGLP